MEENCRKTFQELKKVVSVLNPRVLFANENEFAFEHAEQPKFINEGKVDQDAEQCLENKTTESLNQTLVSENDCLKKTIAKLQNDFSKLEAQRIAFEIALQHKYQENNSLKTLQKENENFLASLQIENAHLKQTYKDLYESVQRSNVESNQCDEVKVKVNFDEIETNNIELEHRVSSLLKENEHLKVGLQKFV
ncbi:hypothetical protein Tco_0409812 [Tanacetum coccineum]